jgi:uncharacterized protein
MLTATVQPARRKRPCSLAARCLGLLFICATLSLIACNGSNAPAASAAGQQPSGQPQPKLPTIKLWLGAHEIIAEQATSRDQIEKGMMFRREMAENEGMLFVFVAPHRASFWMRNTLIPLSSAYIDPEGVILEIHEMKALDEEPVTAKSDRVQYVLEMNKGWFERNNVKAGARVRTERGTLSQTYFGARRD